MSLKIGFTGTRSGMSDKQKKELNRILLLKLPAETYHGGCIGADQEFHEACKGFYREVFPGHSGLNPAPHKYTGSFQDADFIHESQNFYKRNRDIVDRSDLVIAAPYNNGKGGTWYTIEYAKSKDVELIILER